MAAADAGGGGMTLTDADAARLLRMASALRETAAAAARLSSDWSEDALFAANILADVTASTSPDLGALPAAADLQTSPRREVPKRGAAFKAECRVIAEAWQRQRVDSWPEGTRPPSLREDYEAARSGSLATSDGTPIPRAFIRATRWPGWRRGVGRPKKSAGNL